MWFCDLTAERLGDCEDHGFIAAIGQLVYAQIPSDIVEHSARQTDLIVFIVQEIEFIGEAASSLFDAF